jgi:nucleotide-binding universal stress UspA family protein
MSIKKILVPLDGSENAEKIGGWVAGIAQPLGAEVALVTVVDPNKIELPDATAESGHTVPHEEGPFDEPEFDRGRVYTGGSGMGGASIGPAVGETRHAPAFGTQIIDRVMQQAEEYLDQEVDRMNIAGVKCTGKTLMGRPDEVIVQHAKDIKADMIAMATHRGSAIARGVLGSVTDRVLRSANIPVMAVHPESVTAFTGALGQPECIIVPLDGSERSASVFDMAVEIAKGSNAEIVFIRAVQYPYYGVSAVDAAYYQTDYGISYQRREAQDYLAPFVEKAMARGVKARAIVTTGAAASRVIEEAKALPRPLIIMSTRGATGLKRWVLGSVADKVVRSSGLPVLVVPPPEKE